MKKRLIIAVLLVALVVGITGCDKKQEAAQPQGPDISSQTANNPSSNPKTIVSLKEMAAKEKEFLAALTPVYKQEIELYTQFVDGKIDRAKLNDSLKALKPQVDKIKSDSNEYYKTRDISPEDKKSELYTNGLKLGKDLRSEASSFISTAVSGVMFVDPTKRDSSGAVTPTQKNLNDEELKKDFKKSQEKYTTKLQKLNDALSKF